MIAEIKRDQKMRNRYLGRKPPLSYRVGDDGELVDDGEQQQARADPGTPGQEPKDQPARHCRPVGRRLRPDQPRRREECPGSDAVANLAPIDVMAIGSAGETSRAGSSDEWFGDCRSRL